jgi:peptide deformylase
MEKIITVPAMLREVSVDVSSDEGLEIAAELKDILVNGPDKGIGLCAPQIGINKRVIYMHSAVEEFVLINPVVISETTAKCFFEEGCLSIPDTMKPGCRINIERPKQVKIRYINSMGSLCVGKFRGIMGRAVQHELDHLDGKLITDYKKVL